MNGDPADGDLVSSAGDLPADLHGCEGEGLAGPNGVRPHALDGCSRVGKDCVLAAALLSAVKDSECLVYGEDLRVENLLVFAQVVAASSPAVRESPNHRRSHLLAVQARPIRPDGAALSVFGGRDDGPLSLPHDYAAGEAASSSPPLNLNGLLPSEGGCGSEAGGEGRVSALQDLLRPLPALGSGVQASRKAGLAVV